MDGEFAHLSDRDLERLAYGRAATNDEQVRAAAAGRELARRAEALSQQALSQEAGSPGTPAPDAPLDAHHEPERAIEADRPWWRRPIAAVAAGILVLAVAGGTLIAPTLLGVQDDAPEAFAIFEREPTHEEQELRTVLRSGGHLAPLGPRLLGEVGFGTVVAWLPRPAGTIRQTAYDGINPADGPAQVCVGVIEEDPVARSSIVSEWACSEVADFAENGVDLALPGMGGRYEVRWRPSGGVTLDVEITEAQRNSMDPGFRRVLLPGAFPPVPYPQDTAALIYDQTGYVETSIRLVTPVGEVVESSTATEEMLIAFTGRGMGVEGPETACLAVVNDEELFELACTDEGSMAAGSSVSIGVTRGIATFVATWTTEGDITLQGSAPR